MSGGRWRPSLAPSLSDLCLTTPALHVEQLQETRLLNVSCWSKFVDAMVMIETAMHGDHFWAVAHSFAQITTFEYLLTLSKPGSTIIVRKMYEVIRCALLSL